MTARQALAALAMLSLAAWFLLLAGLVWVRSARPDRPAIEAVAPDTPSPRRARPSATQDRTGSGQPTATPSAKAQPSTTVAPTVTASPSGAASEAPRVVTGTPGAAEEDPSLPAAVDWPATPDLVDRLPLATSAHFRVFAADDGDDLLQARAAAWSDRLEEILDADRRRLAGRTLAGPVNVVFARRYEARCPARGLAATREAPPLLMVFIDERSSPVQIEAVLAHELAHHLTLDDRFVGDGVLTEGIANWGGGQAVLRWQGHGDWPSAVRATWRRGQYVSITDETALQPRDGEDCIARRDRVYNIRTAFVDWLIGRIGLERVLAMPAVSVTWTDAQSGERRQRILPDYETAAGASLGQLERSFLLSLGLGGPEAVMLQLRLEFQGVDVQHGQEQ